MNNQQLDLFSQTDMDNPLKDRYVCLTGRFKMPARELKEQLMSIGAKGIKKKKEDKEDEGEKYRFTPTKYIHFFVVGSDPNEDSLKRYLLNKHDGFHAKMISEDQLYEYLAGRFSKEDMVPEVLEKHIHLDMSYYSFTAPIIKDTTFLSRVSSPLQYDADCSNNPITQKEIYVPTIEGVDMDILRQLIGNLGGYANTEYYDDTNIVMLSNSTFSKLEQGIRDEVILGIESKYNKSDSRMFNVQFTCESEFISWARTRMEVFPDKSTIDLLEQYNK